MAFAERKNRWTVWFRTETGRRTVRRARFLFVAGIVAFLFYEIGRIGWQEVLRALPTNVWFYVTWAGMYLALPLSDYTAYRVLWKIPFLSSILVFFRKRVYSTDVMNYSGEVYGFFWARKHVDLPDRELAKDVRDNTIVSSATSTLISLVVLTGYVVYGPLSLDPLVGGNGEVYLGATAVAAVALGALAYRFRAYLFDLTLRTAATLAAIHGTRIVVVLLLQIVQWAVVLPDVPYSIWFSFLAVQILVNALPFAPSKDLIFMSIGVGMAGPVGVPEAAMASMLLARSVLDKGLNLIIFVYTSIRRPGQGLEEIPDEQAVHQLRELGRRQQVETGI